MSELDNAMVCLSPFV